MSAEATLPDPAKWVDNYADILYSYAITRVNDDELARDLVQETFLAALHKVQAFEGRSSERTWLIAILKNKIIDVYRKNASAPVFSGIDIAIEAQRDFFNDDDGHWKEQNRPLAWGIDGDAALHNKEFNGILKKCMQKLPPLWLSVFTMKHMDEEITETICHELRITAANFWVIIHRAKLNLRACLQKHWL